MEPQVMFFIELAVLVLFLSGNKVESYDSGTKSGTATFYGGSDASGTMGGACGYGDLYSAGYGADNTALSTALFNDGAACGECYKITCDYNADKQYCLPGAYVIVTVTNLCPPNYALANDNGGWCNPPQCHFDMSQPAWQKIGVFQAGIIPVMYQRVSCSKIGGVRFTISGHDYFQLVLVTNVGGGGSIQSISIKGCNTGWMTLCKNWGANWQSNAYLNGQSMSLSVTTTDGQTLIFVDIAPTYWYFGQTFTSSQQFY